MINLSEFRKKPDRLSDLLFWAALVAPGIVLNKDGSFQRTFKFRGPDLASATEEELLSCTCRINNIFKRLSGDWAIFAESQRVRSQKYPESKFPDPVTLMIDEERRIYFSDGNHYENENFLTLLYIPPRKQVNAIKQYLIESTDSKQENYWDHLKYFQNETKQILSLLSELMSDTAALNDEETLTFLHSCISIKKHRVRVPEIPIYLDTILSTPFSGGFKPRLEDHFLRVVSIMGFPGSATPAILDNLNWLNFEYRWVTRYIPLDKIDAQKELKQYRKKWFANREGVFQMIKEVLTGSKSAMQNNDAITKSNDADEALQELDADYVNYGYFTAAVVVWDKDINMVDKKVNAVSTTINSLGFITIDEDVNAIDAWLGTIPGNCRANIRRPLINSLNLAHMFPLSTVWAGPEKNKHLDAPVLMYSQTPGNTPFRFDLHVGDVGHCMIVGPTGAGKSTLLALMAAQFRRYKDSQVYIFDKDESSKALTAGVGGQFYNLAEEKETLSFQPLVNIDDINERTWAAEWICDFLIQSNIIINPHIQNIIWTALTSLASDEIHHRTITGLWGLIQDKEIRAALEPLTVNGAFGKLFDASEDRLEYGRWQVFEIGKLMSLTSAVTPALNYLFHKVEKYFTGAPTLLIIDEGWQTLKNSSFAAKFEEWLVTLRKANVSVIFATQSLGQINDSPLAQTIMEACQTKIYLPNPNALSKEIAPLYESFGLNDTERQIIAEAMPKRQYYYKSQKGSRLFELALDPIALAYCGSSSKQDRLKIDQIKAMGEDFNEKWLRYKKLSESAESYHNFVNNISEEKASNF